MNKEFLALKQQIESQNAKSPLFTKEQRLIIEKQDDLNDAKLFIEIKKSFSELCPHRADEKILPHLYTFKDYALGWVDGGNGKFQFQLSNLKAQKTLPLLKAPIHLQKISLDLLENFLEMLDKGAQVFQNLEDE